MGLGITGASITSFVNGTTEDGPTVTANDQNLKTWGINNDGVITTDGGGNMSLVGVILSALLQSSVGLTINDAATTTGTTAGSCTKYAICIGQFKAYLFHFNGYRNSTATEQRITLDTAFTSRVLFLTGNIPNASVWNGGSQVANQTGDVLSLSSSGGTSGGYTTFHPLDFGEVSSAMDQLGLGVSQAGTYTGILFLIGV